MSRLFGNLLHSSGKRYFFALDGVPGILAPGVGLVTLEGRQPIAVEPQTIFRTPATATLTLNGVAFAAPSTVIPATAALSSVGQIPAEVRELTIFPALPAPIQDPPQDFVPTLITIWTTSPSVGFVQLQTLEINVTQGGNIGFVSPGTAQVSLGTQQFTLLLLAGGAGVGELSLVGLQPTLTYELRVSPDIGQVMMTAQPPVLTLPFVWIDDDPVPPSTWITDRAA
jgi:hypothetical protein